MSICSNMKIKMGLKNKILNKQNKFENKIQITNICINLQTKTIQKQKENQNKTNQNKDKYNKNAFYKRFCIIIKK